MNIQTKNSHTQSYIASQLETELVSFYYCRFVAAALFFLIVYNMYTSFHQG